MTSHVLSPKSVSMSFRKTPKNTRVVELTPDWDAGLALTSIELDLCWVGPVGHRKEVKGGKIIFKENHPP